MVQFVANGIIMGAIISLAATGLTLIYSVLKLTNFAYGDMVTFGAYVALFLNVTLYWDPWWAVPAAFALGAMLGIATDLGIWRKMRSTQASGVSLIIASIGLALILRNLIVFFFGPQTQGYRVPIQLAERIGPVRLTPMQVDVAAAAVLSILAVHAVLRYTLVGKAMRALADNRDLAWVSGIDVDRVVLWTWVMGGGMAGVGGVLLGMIRPIDPNLGWFLLLPMFAAIILGGLGNAYGALLGGLVIGLAQEVSVVFLPANYKLGVAFAVMILVLLALPRGLFGQRSLT